MYDLKKLLNTQSKLVLLLICLYLILAFVTPYQKQFTGLALGTVGTLINLWWMVRKTLIFRKKLESQTMSFASLGFLQRFATVCALSFLALQFPDIISIKFMLLGIATLYVLIKVDYGIYLFSKYHVNGTPRKLNNATEK